MHRKLPHIQHFESASLYYSESLTSNADRLPLLFLVSLIYPCWDQANNSSSNIGTTSKLFCFIMHQTCQSCSNQATLKYHEHLEQKKYRSLSEVRRHAGIMILHLNNYEHRAHHVQKVSHSSSRGKPFSLHHTSSFFRHFYKEEQFTPFPLI